MAVSKANGHPRDGTWLYAGWAVSQYPGRYEPQPKGGILVYLRFAWRSSAKRIVIYVRYVMNAAFGTRNGWLHAVTRGILRACARNIRSGDRLPRPMFWEVLRPCEESQSALASYCA